VARPDRTMPTSTPVTSTTIIEKLLRMAATSLFI
jgi:hypothetical protein